MPEDRKTFHEIVTDIAFRKDRATESRFGREAAHIELPREVYEESCRLIAEALESDGYRYSKSGQHITRSSKDFKFRISFQSSHNNVASEFVALWIHGNVVSPKLKKWRHENRALRRDFDFLAGGQIGNLRKNSGWLEWNLADHSRRDQQIDDAVRHIREIIFPYFSLFDDIPTACEALIADDIPAFSVIDVVDFLQCFGTPGQARSGASNFLARHSNLEDDYGTALERFTLEGIPDRIPSAHAEALAAASIIYDFGDLRKME